MAENDAGKNLLPFPTVAGYTAAVKMTPASDSRRDSGTEALRLCCLFGIVVMHCYGSFLAHPATLTNLLAGELFCTVFNTGVSLFMLISGYYGMRGTWGKAWHLWLMMWLCSLLSYALGGIGAGWSAAGLTDALLPLCSGRYWFMNGYLLILLVSPWVNRVAERLPRRRFLFLLGGGVLLLGVLPMMLGTHALHDGKNPANMLLMYMAGRFVRLHLPDKQCFSTAFACAALPLAAVLAGDVFLSLCFKGGQVTMLPLAADHSPLIMAGAVGIFLAVRACAVPHCAVLNAVARQVLAVYLLEAAFRTLLFRFCQQLNAWESAWFFPLVILAAAAGITLLCLAAGAAVGVLQRPLEAAGCRLFDAVSRCFHR